MDRKEIEKRIKEAGESLHDDLLCLESENGLRIEKASLLLEEKLAGMKYEHRQALLCIQPNGFLCLVSNDTGEIMDYNMSNEQYVAVYNDEEDSAKRKLYEGPIISFNIIEKMYGGDIAYRKKMLEMKTPKKDARQAMWYPMPDGSYLDGPSVNTCESQRSYTGIMRIDENMPTHEIFTELDRWVFERKNKGYFYIDLKYGGKIKKSYILEATCGNGEPPFRIITKKSKVKDFETLHKVAAFIKTKMENMSETKKL